MHELTVAGGGSGQPEYMLPIVKNVIEKADFVIASKRFIEIIDSDNIIPLKNIYKQIEEIPVLLKSGNVVVIVSGDPLFYSIYNTIKRRFPDIKINALPGIGSLQLLGTKFGITMENAKILSLHGRSFSKGKIALAVSENESVFFFCSKECGIHEIAESLLEYKINDVKIYVGESLTYPEEKLYCGTPEEIALIQNPELCVAAVVNLNSKKTVSQALLPDSAFIRNETPMTKEEVRAVILCKLRLSADSVVWDIGAGTGSISVEIARLCPFGKVYSVEYKKNALEILEKNRDYFDLKNMEIIPQRAEYVIDKLPLPDCIFIGGGGHSISDILEKIINIPKKIHLAVSAVTLETQSKAYLHMNKLPDFQTIQICIGSAKPVGSYDVMNFNNPVTLYLCETRE